MRSSQTDSEITLLHGDVLEVLRGLPDASVDCVVTSPPYYGLRDYDTGDRQLGLEATPELYIERMVEVFREVHRVLCSHGTVWLNLGDSYSSTGGHTDTEYADRRGQYRIGTRPGPNRAPASGLKQKDMFGMPWRVALALQADGWWLRSDIIWSKPNPMPESIRDRPTKSHEYVFLLAKAPRYFFDQDAIREEALWDRWGDQTNAKHEGSESAASWIGDRPKAELTAHRTKRPDGWASREGAHGSIHREGREKGAPARLARVKPLVPQSTEAGQGRNGLDSDTFGEYAPHGRNSRTVWEIPTQPFPAAHFATFPEELARRCVVAGCAREVCTNCGRPRERITEVSYDDEGRTTNGPRSMERRHLEHGTAGFEQRLVRTSVGLGWTECECDAPYRRGVVLDPFIGSGTVAVIAKREERDAIGIDLSEAYLELARTRLTKWWRAPARAQAPEQMEGQVSMDELLT